MARMNFMTAVDLIRNAAFPEDLFGVWSGTKDEVSRKAKRKFLTFVAIVHPDKHTGSQEKERANEAMTVLNLLWGTAQKKITEGTYGDRNAAPKNASSGPITFKTGKHLYVVTKRIHSGGTCGIFEGMVQGKGAVSSSVIIRIPHTTGDNDLMEREARAFKLMKEKAKEISGDPDGKKFADLFLECVPRFLESVKLFEPGMSEKKAVNILFTPQGLERGWYTLEEIRKEHPDGVSTRVMAFIWRRLFEGLTFAHFSGVTHNAVTPNHVLIYAEEYRGNIIDWTASCRINEREHVPYIDDRYRSYFPDEILDKNGIPSPSSDIFMSAWCMVYLLGGDPKEGFIPDSVEKPIREFLNRCLQPKRKLRPATAEIAYKEFQQIITDLWGPRKFVELAMPRV